MGEKKRQKEASARGTHIENAYVGRSLWKRKQSEPIPFTRPAGGSDGQLNVIHPRASAHIKAIRFIVFYCRHRPVGFDRLPASHINALSRLEAILINE
jgi:hypothetical protein